MLCYTGAPESIRVSRPDRSVSKSRELLEPGLWMPKFRFETWKIAANSEVLRQSAVRRRLSGRRERSHFQVKLAVLKLLGQDQKRENAFGSPEGESKMQRTFTA